MIYTKFQNLLPNFGFTQKERIDHIGVLQTPTSPKDYADHSHSVNQDLTVVHQIMKVLVKAHSQKG